MRLCPPASTFASLAVALEDSSASSSVAGAKYSNLRGVHGTASLSAPVDALPRRAYASPVVSLPRPTMAACGFGSVEEVEQALSRRESYLPDRGLATAVYLALAMRRPLLLEGEAGVGKTEVGKTLAAHPRRRADPAPVLRGDRRRAGALRVGLRAPAPVRAGAPGGRGRPRARRGALRARVPARAAAPARDPRRLAAPCC